MKKSSALLVITALSALPLCAADLADEIKSAAKKLADKPNYSWTAKSDSGRPAGDQDGQGGRRGGGRGFGGGGTTMPDGRTEKDGFTVLSYRFGTNTPTEVIVKAGKTAVKSGDEWKTAEELADSGDSNEGNRRFNTGQFMARRAQTFKAPATSAQELVGQVTGLKKEGDAYAGELTADAIKQMYTFRGGRPGGNNENAPPPLDTSGIKGTVKFWITDGVLSKYEQHVEGKMKGREDRDFDIKRTTTVEIKDVGTTKVSVPAEAKKKLSAS